MRAGLRKQKKFRGIVERAKRGLKHTKAENNFFYLHIYKSKWAWSDGHLEDLYQKKLNNPN